jgi:ADP-ribosylglycohydrolase
LRTPDDYWEAICTAIAVGGDVDMTAAMTGELSGAHLGFDRLPVDRARQLTDQGTGRLSELVGLAHRSHAIEHGGAVR